MAGPRKVPKAQRYMYVGIVDGDDGTWGVVIPDFPGCHGGGATPEAAVKDAVLALREFAAMMEAGGETMPQPTDLGTIQLQQRSGELDEGGLVYIPLLLDARRSVRANVSLDAGLLEAIDREARRRGLTRSAFLASAAIEKIAAAS